MCYGAVRDVLLCCCRLCLDVVIPALTVVLTNNSWFTSFVVGHTVLVVAVVLSLVFCNQQQHASCVKYVLFVGCFLSTRVNGIVGLWLRQCRQRSEKHNCIDQHELTEEYMVYAFYRVFLVLISCCLQFDSSLFHTVPMLLALLLSWSWSWSSSWFLSSFYSSVVVIIVVMCYNLLEGHFVACVRLDFD